VRRIPLSRRSHIIGFQPLGTGTVEHESALERDFVTLTSFLDAQAVITSQPLTISFREADQARRYTPDFLVHWSGGRRELVEVKYRQDLHANWSRLKPGFLAARRWAQEHGATFSLATERRIRCAALPNAKRQRRAAGSSDRAAASRRPRISAYAHIRRGPGGRACAAQSCSGHPMALDCPRRIACGSVGAHWIGHDSFIAMSATLNAPELSLVSMEHWEQARRRLPVIRQLIDCPKRTRAQVLAAAALLGQGPTQIYVLLRRYQADPRLTSLLPQHGGPVRGYSRLSGEIDALIDEAIETVYLSQRRPRLADLVIEVRKRCHERALNAPGRKAITTRLRAKPRSEVVARREGRKAARDRFAPATGSLEAAYPLSLIQIDHTLVDVIVVDSSSRVPVQRPWLTLAIDVCSRCVAGFHLSLEPPCATSVALCITHAALSKEAWLAERHIEARWPHGLMQRLHLDNAREFRCEALRRGCEQYGIAIDYRPVRTPHYGGHIERLIGTLMGKVHLLC